MASGGSLAQDALKYQGAAYTWGGAPAAGIGHWDCSSFVNWCAGHDLGLAIPGYAAGTYDGRSHGPVVVEWAAWNGCTTVKGPPSNSDLCIWAGIGATGHIGIAIDGSNMISALDTKYGTVQTPIAGNGPAGVPVIYRRINAAAGPGNTAAASGCLVAIIMELAREALYAHKGLW